MAVLIEETFGVVGLVIFSLGFIAAAIRVQRAGAIVGRLRQRGAQRRRQRQRTGTQRGRFQELPSGRHRHSFRERAATRWIPQIDRRVYRRLILAAYDK